MTCKSMLTRVVVVFLMLFAVSESTIADGVVVYSARKEALIKPLLDRFTEKTGIKVQLLTGKADGLLKRLQIEGKASPADVFITVDAGRLHRAKKGGVLQPVRSDVLESVIPQNMRDSDHYWYSLSRRARPIFYSKSKFKNPELIKNYENLADEHLRGTLCLRSSDAVYNQSLVASMMVANGVEATQSWIKGIVANFARKPVGGDTEQLLALANGECALTFVNTYYYGRMLASDKAEIREAAEKIGVIWPNQKNRGTHVNVSGAGVTASARNYDSAVKLLEYLVEPKSQAWYAEVNNEYPVREDATISERMQQLGTFKSDTVNLKLLGEYNLEAVKLMDIGGWR